MERETAEGRFERPAGVLFAITLAATLALVAVKDFTRFDASTLYDDAYMFQRYAHNLLHGRGISWNPDGLPTYGLTSPLFLVVSVPARALAGGRAALGALLSSLVSGVAFLALAARLVKVGCPGPVWLRRVVLLVVTSSVGLSLTWDHFVGGMDTAFAMAVLAGYLLVLVSLEAAPTARKAAAFGAFGGLLFSVRPEFSLYAACIPLALAFLGRDAAERRLGRVALAATAATAAVYFLAARLYFGTALPLAWYAKSLDLYGDVIKRSYEGKTTIELVGFLAAYAPVVLVVAVDLLSEPRQLLRRVTPGELGTLVATLLFIGYMWLLVLPIMGYEQRFYQPMLPALVLLFARSAARLLEKAPAPSGSLAWAGALFCVLVGIWVFPALGHAGQEAMKAVTADKTLRFDALAFSKQKGPQGNWFKPDGFSLLPRGAVMAATEVGLLSALAPERTIIDMTGLNDREFAHRRFSAEAMFARGSPDVIYMPHPDYRDMIEDLLRDPHMAEYDLHNAKSLGAIFGLAIKRSSPHYKAMRALIGERAPVKPAEYKR